MRSLRISTKPSRLGRHLLCLAALAGALAVASGAEQTAPAASAASGSPAKAGGPKIRFAGTTFDFGRIESGEAAKHSFIFTNAGDRALKIISVQPGCGCTTVAGWDKEVEPGKTGAIPIQFNSGGYHGAVEKSIAVSCNDAEQSKLTLVVRGSVWKPVEIQPVYLAFSLGPDAQNEQTQIARIINQLTEPLAVSDVRCANPAFKAALTTVKEGREYELRITVVPPLKSGTVSAPVTFKTSYAKMPAGSVTAYAVVRPAVSVTPPELTLPAGPLSSALRKQVRILNNSTNPLTLSEPAISAAGAQVAVKEIEPGREFNLELSFPAGFKSQPGQQIEAVVKSSHPGYARIKVPVVQTQSPSAIAVEQTGSSAEGAPAAAAAQPAAQAPVAADRPANADAPRIRFAETVFDFGRVEAGSTVSHDFVFTNSGKATLEITEVKSACSCTITPNYTRRVEPGKTGIIPVVYSASALSGPTGKGLWIACNDPEEPSVLLRIAATIWKPIDALPSIAAFNFGPDLQTNATLPVRLVSNLSEPVTLSEPICTNPPFQAVLRTVQPGKEFELRVSVVPPFGPGSKLAPITLKSSSAKMPVVTVNAFLNVQPSLVVKPPSLTLPAGPLKEGLEVSVTIQNRSTNALVLTEPVINAKEAGIQVQEVEPGRLFKLALKFPAGYRATGPPVEARVKSNHPQFPSVNIPVRQAAPVDAEQSAAPEATDQTRTAPVTTKR